MKHIANHLWHLTIVFMVAIDIIGSAYFETGKTYMLFVCLALAFVIKSKSILFNKDIVFPLVLVLSFCCLLLLQQIFIVHYDTDRQIVFLLYTSILLFYARKGITNEIYTLSLCVKVLSIIGTISVLLITGLHNDVMFREDALIDKGMLTMWYAMLYCITISDILMKRNIILNGLLFVSIFAFNLFIVQSKTATFTACVFVVMVYLLSEKELRKRYKRWLLPILLTLAVAIVMYPDDLLPESMRIATNHIVGTEVFSVDAASKQFNTFYVRQEIDAFTLMLFLEHPLIGIGCGGYKNYAFLGITECENTYADIFVEGGILWGIPMLLIMGYILYHAIMNVRKKRNVSANYMCLAIIISMIIAFRYNDFVRPFTFIYLGCCYFIVSKSRKVEANRL